MTSTDTPAAHYLRPGWATRNLFNRSVRGLTRLGVSVWGSRVLETTGRRSGLARRTPVNLLRVGDAEYLVSARGRTEWVRNAEAGGGEVALLIGRRRRDCRLVAVNGADRLPVLRAYLRRWSFEVGAFFDGVGADSSDAELAAAADRHPVFAVLPR